MLLIAPMFAESLDELINKIGNKNPGDSIDKMAKNGVFATRLERRECFQLVQGIHKIKKVRGCIEKMPKIF